MPIILSFGASHDNCTTVNESQDLASALSAKMFEPSSPAPFDPVHTVHNTFRSRPYPTPIILSFGALHDNCTTVNVSQDLASALSAKMFELSSPALFDPVHTVHNTVTIKINLQ
ncbi:hypothetical protein ZHAS_00009795 [Anopheles sinensis]|uniref:Uncharacterized protein n=1 Tax=Anopheles sinensis TaxID=74873 RepID=A0A084VVX8_ANOSI|nr:hypothetical protein ZHAS_00009795 [Anopheles sinensis]